MLIRYQKQLLGIRSIHLSYYYVIVVANSYFPIVIEKSKLNVSLDRGIRRSLQNMNHFISFFCCDFMINIIVSIHTLRQKLHRHMKYHEKSIIIIMIHHLHSGLYNVTVLFVTLFLT